MKSKFNKLSLLLLILLSLSIMEIKGSKNKLKISLAEKMLKTNQNISKNEIASYASECIISALQSIPPSFCKKSKEDAGIIPIICPIGYFRNSALCYENCKDGYIFADGVCWEKCKNGYTDMEVSCYKHNLFKSLSYFKKLYKANFITNFSNKVECSPKTYKSGTLCYRDCKSIGLVNCNTQECASTSLYCNKTTLIKLTSIDAITKVLKFGLVTSLDSNIIAAKKDFSKFDTTTLINIISSIKSNSNIDFLDNFKSSVETKALKAIKKINSTVSDNLVSNICKLAIDKVQSVSAETLPTSLALTTLMPNKIRSVINTCSINLNTDESKIICSKKILDSISIQDITGLVAMSGSIPQQSCPMI